MVKFPLKIKGTLRDLADTEPDDVTWEGDVCYVNKDEYTYVFVPLGYTHHDVEKAFPGATWEKLSPFSYRLRRADSERPV